MFTVWYKFYAKEDVGGSNLRTGGANDTPRLDIKVWEDKTYSEKQLDEGVYLPFVKITVWGQVAEQIAQRGIRKGDLITVANVTPSYSPFPSTDNGSDLVPSFQVSVNRYDQIDVVRHTEEWRKNKEGGSNNNSSSSTTSRKEAAKQAANDEDAIPF